MNHGEHHGESIEQSPGQPKLCANNCGFFANQACMEMCSKCYREFIADQERAKANEAAAAAAVAQVSAVAEAPPLPLPQLQATSTFLAKPVVQASIPAVAATVSAPEPCPVASSSAEAAASAVPAAGGSPQKNLNRCFTCNKRVGLTGFKCRCGYVFCANHRYAEKHACSFDYKAMERQKLAKANPLVTANKVEKF